jgi:hypothetical protein
MEGLGLSCFSNVQFYRMLFTDDLRWKFCIQKYDSFNKKTVDEYDCLTKRTVKKYDNEKNNIELKNK